LLTQQLPRNLNGEDLGGFLGVVWGWGQREGLCNWNVGMLQSWSWEKVEEEKELDKAEECVDIRWRRVQPV